MGRGHLWVRRERITREAGVGEVPVKRPPQSMFLPGALAVAWAWEALIVLDAIVQ